MSGPASDAPRTRRLDEALARLADAAARDTTARIEAQIPGIIQRLVAAGVDVVVLKGPTTRQRLYGPEETRPVADVDVLVEPRRFGRAARVLRDAGYRRYDRHGHSDAFTRDASDADIDLHLTLPYVARSPQRAWRVFAAHRTTMEIGGAAIGVLDEPAHAVHLAIHAAVNRFDSDHRSVEEWRRAHRALDDDARVAARGIAAELGVEPIWTVAVQALPDDADPAALTAALPVWEAVPRVWSLRGYVGAGTPLRVKWRDFQRLAALQWSDDTLNKWRVRRGRPPLPSGGWRIRLDKPVRLVAVSCAGLARLAGFGSDPGERPGSQQ